LTATTPTATTPTAAPDPQLALLRHAVATLAYRGGKTLRGCPEGFAELRASPTTRTPLEILTHLGDLLDWATSMARGRQEWKPAPPLPWDREVERFFAALATFDEQLAGGVPPAAPPEKLFQGPIADALTHVGQLALLRRVAGAPVRGENYYRADIAAGRVGPEQSPPVREFD
jgi:hypothetical protein